MSDLISRQEAIKVVDSYIGTDPIVEKIKAIPSAETKGDLISREEAIKALEEVTCDICKHNVLESDWCIGCDKAILLGTINSIPSAEKVGEWIITDETPTLNKSYTCDQCGYRMWVSKVRMIGDSKEALNYCPYCGAKMERRTDEHN